MNELIRFSVRYRLGEYLAFVREHALQTGLPPDASALDRHTVRVMVTLVGCVMFLVKSYRVGTCHFQIDDAGITRRSKHGEASVPWSEVTAVHAYAAGFLIEKGQGGMPIPFRVLSNGQRARLSAMVASHLRSPGPS